MEFWERQEHRFLALRIQDQYQGVKKLVVAMSMMHEEHDHHGPQVAALSKQLAAARGLPESQVALIEIGAWLHDIGKLMISRELLNLKRKLEPAELKTVQQHTTLGWAIVDQAGFEPEICDIVRHHHERYDGNGYPDRLPADQILIGPQIVAICDVYSALTHPRPYRPGYTARLARSYLQTGKGQAHDPQLVDLFFDQVVTE
jgi:putative nucleotidyltransferase with HDIG domain